MMSEETQDNTNENDDPKQDESQVEDIDNQDQDEDEDEKSGNEVVIADAGTLKKKVTITIHRDHIDKKHDEMFGELSDTAQVPGFRIGRAPRRLLEKRFGKEVSSDVRNALIGEALNEVLEGNDDLDTIGEPDLDIDNITMPDTGDMEFSFEVEVKPEFDLPELDGIAVNKVKAEMTDEHMNSYLTQMTKMRTTYEDTDDATQEGDEILASATISADGIDDAKEYPGLTLKVAAGEIEQLPLMDLGKALEGKKAGETAELTVTANDSHPNENWRGKEITVAVTISQVRKRIVPTMDDAFAETMGYDSLDDLREQMTNHFMGRYEAEINRSMHDQICMYLLENTELDIPEGVAERHTAQTVQRQYVELLQSGVPKEEVEQRLTAIKADAIEQTQQSLKIQFILAKIIDSENITVEDTEINTRIHQMAAPYGRRPERLRQELEANGSLNQLYMNLLEEKAIAKLLVKATITEVEPEANDADAKAKSDESEKKKIKKKVAKKKTTSKDEKKTSS